MLEPLRLLIYRNFLLPPSQTFIRNQAESFQTFIPHYVGLKSVPGLMLPANRCHIVNSGGFVGKWQEVSTKWGWFPTRFVSQLQQLQPQLIHAHFAQDGVMALPLAQGLGLPLVVTVHGYDITVKDAAAEKSLIQQRYFRQRDWLKQRAHLFIAVSQFLQQQLLAQGFPSEKILVHYIGIDPDRFRPDPAVPRQPIVLFVGRLVEKKGCEYLIQAMSRVQAQRPEMELVIIGDGKQRSHLEQLAHQQLGRYRFLGVQPPEQVQAWLNRASLFSVPSITARSGDAEGFGLVFAEAQAMGVPVVSFASGGVSEAVADGETGFLVPERDTEALAAAIIRLLQDPDLWQRFSLAGQQRVRTQFNLHHQTRLLEQIYVEQVLGAKPLKFPDQNLQDSSYVVSGRS